MATALATALNGLGLFVSTLLSLRDQRFLATVEAVTSAVTCMTMSLTLCFLAIHRHARVEAGGLNFRGGCTLGMKVEFADGLVYVILGPEVEDAALRGNSWWLVAGDV
ncbi:hypothetical protein DKX38_018680 [Salix brachista]|uniref:Uncharacterized protein n=1 Tax=Salix brachista TaxID=2182728 RepID=A0A5N5KNR2_9ROSI|nr:hypothetical protein DKX38_018680 [Salix brachista]